MTEPTQRRLAAIVSVDVVGYSRLMGVDEVGTLKALKNHRAELIDAKITEHGGRIVKTMGDGLLLEFPSIVNATECALEIQTAMADRNDDIDEDRRITFRIGINLGDIIIEGEDILGDGVNIAARIEAMSEPGGVALSHRTYEDVRDRLEAVFVDTGEHSMKNIARPIRVWQWLPETPDTDAQTTKSPQLLHSDKPSIAVLPFDNMSNDPDQEYFADGLAEDIITHLSRFHWLLVTARNSSFTYKGQAVDIKRVGDELGVRYVLEGSVRKSGDRIRVTAQLIDAETGSHVWAERYDRDLEDLFGVQDEITESITGSVAPEFLSAEIGRAKRRDERSLSTWDVVMRANWFIHQNTKEDAVEARKLLRKAIEIDPLDSNAFSSLALTYVSDILYGWTPSAATSMVDSVEAAQTAISLDNSDALAHATLGGMKVFAKQPDDAVRALEKAIKLNPNLAFAHGFLGAAHAFAGRYEPAVENIRRAVHLSPRDPNKPLWLASQLIAAFYIEKYDEAIALCLEILDETPDFPSAHRGLTACYSMLGREAEAEAALAELLRVAPQLTIAQTRAGLPITNPEVLERYLGGLRTAGLPEG
jgi:TolB-like protein/cytochrome c-type biogenesis protein CcmH/NrfG